MKPIRLISSVLGLLLGFNLPVAVQAATTYTDGTASFSVNLLSIPGNYSQRVDAYWVTDASGQFVQTVRRDANNRRNYLYQWIAARGSWPYDQVDGYSGATISTWGAFTVTWDCRNTNNVLMPDGQYKFWVEMTDYNGQGPYTTNGIPFYKGLTNVNQTYANQQYIQNISVTYTPALAYNVAVTSLAPVFAPTNSLVTMTVGVTNITSVAAVFTLTLSNATTGTVIGSTPVSLGGNESTNMVIIWNTGGLGVGAYSIAAHASPVPGETSLADNVLVRSVGLRPPTHDVGVTAIGAPAVTRPNMQTNVTVTVTNKGDAAESFAVVLADVSDSKTLGTNQVVSLPPQSGGTLNFTWNTVGASWGAHTLRATAEIVPSETATADNSFSVLATVMPPNVTNVYLTKSNYWRYHDQGVDLGTDWRLPAYNDSSWPQGRGPLGYSDAPLNTVLNYGMNSSSKYPTYYFRAGLNLSTVPSVLTMRLRRDDGAVVYINGVEAYRTNMPTGTITYNTLALTSVGGTDETTYFQTNLPTANLVLGSNVIAVEVHQNAVDSSDLSFDLELLGEVPPFVPAHDVAVLRVTVPAQVYPGVTTNVVVTVTNLGSFGETFPVVLTDLTDSLVLGSNQVTSLASNAGRQLTFAWTPPASPWMSHTLRATAGLVTGETSQADNTNIVSTFVAPPLETNVFVARSNLWRYSDAGADLTYSPWKAVDFFDSAWPAGRGPLGYGDPVTTTNGYGPDANNKYPTTYYRRAFNVDALPIWMYLRLRADDGAVVYLNGSQLHRVNLTNNPVTYSSYASATVDGTNETTYFESPVPVTEARLGTNMLAVEVHQVSASSGDLSFDAELIGVSPLTPRTHRVAVLEVQPQANALAGDLMRVAVTVTNLGNASETFTVVLVDTNANRVVASGVFSNLSVSAASTVTLNWNTTGATPGQHGLAAMTVIGGVTNLADAGSVSAEITATGFGLRPSNLAGAIGGRCGAVAMIGSNLLIGAGATLEVWSATNPAAPLKLGEVRLPGVIESIAASGTAAFVACGNAGVQFVSLASPEAPEHVNTLDTSGHAYGVALSGNYLYVADGVSGLRVLNVSTAAAPVLVSSLYTEGPARAIALSSPRAVLLDAEKGALILNIANPASPTVLGSAPFHGGQAVAIYGSHAYVADGHNHFLAVNFANLSAPYVIGSLTLTNRVGQGVVVASSMAYVPLLDGGLAVINVSTPASPTLVGVTPVPALAQSLGVAAGGGKLCLANGLAGFQIYDVAAPANPVLLADAPTAMRACDVAMLGPVAVVAAGETGLRLYDVANPARPAWVGWLGETLNARCVALSGNMAVVGDGQFGLKTVNLANPAAPALLGSWNGGGFSSFRNVAVSGTLAVASDGRNLLLFDISAPAVPTLAGTYTAPAFIFDLAAAGGRAYLACGEDGLIVLNLAPGGVTQAAVYDSPGFASSVSLSGTTAYLADGPGGWTLLDVSQPLPVVLRTSLSEGPIAQVAVAGVLAALSNANSVQTFEVSTPLTPVPKQNFASLLRALSLAGNGTLVLSAEDDAGLAIGAVSASGDSDGDSLPDAWEQQIVDADPDDAISSIQDVRPNDDFDGDRLPNGAEFIAGTSPVSATSVFAVQAPAQPAGGARTIQWSSLPGRVYSVYKAAGLGAGFTLVQDGLVATPPLNTFTDSAPGDAAFYIISVQAP